MTAKGRLIRNIIIAAAAIVILGGGYYLAQNWTPEKEAETEDKGFENSEIVYLVSEETDGVASITIFKSDKSYSILRSKDADGKNTFYIPEASYELKSSALESAFSSLAKMSASKTITKDISKLADYGLENSALKYVIKKNDGTELTVLIGDEVPTGGEYYAMPDGGDTIYTISSYKAEIVMRGINDYRYTSVTQISDSTTVTEFSLSKGAERIIEVRAATEEENANKLLGSFWTMVYPWNSDMDSEKFAAAIEPLLNIDASGFPAEGDVPAFEYNVKISTADQTYDFSVGAKTSDGGVYLRDEKTSVVYVVDASVLNAVTAIVPNNYTSKLVYIADISKVSVLTVKLGTAEYTMEPGNDDGKPYIICGKEVAEKAFKTDYQTVIGTLFKEYIDYKPSGEPYMTITYKFNDGTPDAAVSYYEFDDRTYAATRPNGSTVSVLKSEVARIAELASRE